MKERRSGHHTEVWKKEEQEKGYLDRWKKKGMKRTERQKGRRRKAEVVCDVSQKKVIKLSLLFKEWPRQRRRTRTWAWRFKFVHVCGYMSSVCLCVRAYVIV